MAQGEVAAKPIPQGRAQSEGGSFDTPTVLTLAGAHMGHDIYTAFVAPLLPLLISRLSLPLSLAGVLPAVFRAGSVVQPFMGMWADRADARYFVILAPTTTALGMSLLGIAPTYLAAVVLLALAGLSHAAFHPAAAATVTRASGRTWGRGTAIYMTGGKMGFAIGPIFIASIVSWLGQESSYVAAIPGFLCSALLYLRLRHLPMPKLKVQSTAGIWRLVRAQGRPILLLSGFVLFRSTTSVSFSTFYPTYLTSMGSSLLFAGFAMTVYQLGGAGGALVGGTLSDLMGRRTMLVGSQLLSGPLLYAALSSPESPLGLTALALGGAMVAGASPVQLALFQELIPGARSTAAGIWSLLSFEGSLATAVIVGVVADWIGLGSSLVLTVFASMLAIPFILALEEPARSR